MIVVEASDRASVPLDDLIEKIKSLTSDMNDAAAKIAVAGDKIDESLVKTAAEGRVAADSLKDSMDKNTNSTNQLTGALKKTLETMDPVSSKLKLIALGITALTGPVSGLLALAPIALFGGLAIGASKYAESLKQAQAQGQKLTATQKQLLPTVEALNKDFAPAAKAAHSVLLELLQVVQRMGPVFQQAGQALGPIVKVLGGGFIQLLEGVLEPLSNMLTNLLPLAKVFASGLNTLGNALAGLFQNLNLNAANQGLADLFNLVGMLLPILGQLLGVLAPIGNVILSVLVPALGGALSKVLTALVPIFNTIAPVVQQFAGVFAELITTFGNLVTAALPLLPIVIKLFTAFDNMDTLFEALNPMFTALAKALAPLLSIIVKIASAVVGDFNTALTQLATALVPLIPVLGNLADSILGALLDLFQALEPAIQPVVDILIDLLPFVGELAEFITKLINVGVVPAIRFFAQLFKALIPLVPVLMQLANTALRAVFQILTAIMPLVPMLMNAFISMLPSITQLIPPLIQILLALMPLIPPLTELAILVIQLALDILGPLIHALTVGIEWFANIIHWIEDLAVPAVKLFSSTMSIMIKGVREILQGIIDFLDGLFTGNWSKVWNGVLSIFKGFVNDLTAPIQSAIKFVGGIPGSVKDLFKDAVTWLLQAGKDIISGLINGIESETGNLIDAAKSVGGTVLSYIKNPLKIFSPSQAMRDEVGKQIPPGIAAGITENMGVIQQAADRLGAFTLNATKSSLNAAGSSAAVGAASSGGGGGATVYIDLRGTQIMTEQDMRKLVDLLGGELAKRILPQGGLRVVMR